MSRNQKFTLSVLIVLCLAVGILLAQQPVLIQQGGNQASVSASNALKVDGSAVTQPVSAASLPLPTGASTAAKQPALGTAGTPSADVITVQGVTSMTPLKVDGSGVTQPISGNVGQTGGPWTINVTQFGGNNAATGAGASGNGIPRVTVANDSFNYSVNGAAAGTNRLPTLPAIARSNFPSAFTAGRDSAPSTDLYGNVLSALMPAASFATYAAAKTGLATAASATDIAVLSGNATNTVIPVLVTMACTQTTAGVQDVQLIIRTTADSGGTSTGSPTTFPLDQNNAAASSSVLTYTANPVVNDGTTRLIDSQHIGVLATTTASPEDIYIWKPAMGQSVVLRGTAQQLAINLNGVTWTGSSCDIKFQWIETTGL